MKNSFIILCMFATLAGISQKKITWEDLAQVKYSDKYFPAYNEYFLYPDFGESLKSLEGKKVSITGYFLNISPQDNLYILSKGPLSSCFFCGMAGPETAIELQFNSKPSFKTDTLVTITGILKLNADDVKHFNYILTNATAEISE